MKKVKICATSANIGAGFDCMGLALNLYNEVLAEPCDRLKIETEAGFAADETNLVYRSMKSVFDLCGKSLAGVHIVQHSGIPPASGLGSSAACVVAGVSLGNALLGSPLSQHALVNLCARLDGHPDNVVPAVTGGIAAGVLTGASEVEYVGCAAPENLTLVAATPDYPLHTELSRSVLPASYSRADTVYSLSRAVVTFAALVKGETDKLRVIGDRLHEPYRIPLIPGYAEVTGAFERAGCLAHYVSGAGPTLMGLFVSAPARLDLPHGWTQRNLHVCNQPLTVEEL